MTISSVLVSGSDEFLQGLAGIDQVPSRESLPSGKACPQADEASGVAREPNCAC